MQMSRPEDYRIENRDIDSLQPHPLNAQAFDEVDDDDFEALVADIDERGMQNMPDILPDSDWILAGHRRIRAYRQLGHKEILCRMRYDLVGATQAEIAVALINDNLHRRQLSSLGVARALLARMDAVNLDAGCYGKDTDLVQPLARILKTSERNARRYLRALKTPMAVQNALESGALSLILADKVAGLSAGKQRQLTKKIDSGMPVKVAVMAVLNNGKKATASEAEPPQSLAQLIAGANAWADAINGGKWIAPQQKQALRKALQGLGKAVKAQQQA
jgi:ParB-like chromosome segregation protein Spo0J